VGVALRAIAEDGDFFVFDEVNVTVTVVINAHFGGPFEVINLRFNIPIVVRGAIAVL
jgi:hypothetical protein